MAYVRAFGTYLPSRVVSNAEIAAAVGVDPAWIVQASGIEERRYAAPEETVADLGVKAARDAIDRAEMTAREIGLVLCACGSAERRFPGPAAAIGAGLGINGVPAIDLPLASAGSLFGMALAAQLCGAYGNVLVVGTEAMSRVVKVDPTGRDTAILFGDGAGACVVSAESGPWRVVDSLLASDGDFANALALEFGSPLYMDGRTIILHASRKLPRAIGELLGRNRMKAAEVGTFVLHQANLNLITRTAQALGVDASRFVVNVQRYGNTSSASMLIAAAEARLEGPVVFGAFGAGLNWGALLACPIQSAGETEEGIR